MARKPKPKPANEAGKSFDEFADDSDVPEEDVPSVNNNGASVKSRDWRDVERYKEMRELKKLVGDDFDEAFDDVLPRRR
jgi:hypothetical protein